MESIIIKYILLLTLLFISISAQEILKRTQVIMGTYVSISLPKEKLSLCNEAFTRLKKINLALSSYSKEAEVYKLNHKKRINISQTTYKALLLSKQYYKTTNGFFDITIGSITKGLFHFGEVEYVPSVPSLLKAKVKFNGLHFTKYEAWIDDGIIIDLGGMGKGFAVDQLVSLLRDKGIRKGVVSLSGDIYCFHKCEMGIQDPFSSKLLATFTMAQPDTSISTSGNYRRYVKSKENNHLINPKTKSSQNNFASITLVSSIYTNADLDAYATAASVMQKKQAYIFLDSMKGIAYLTVSVNNNIYYNQLFKKLTEKFSFN